ncbi:MFS transporter [Aspergillus violaceofuscus CBS 115571]|uniref:MFS transporter n=1 Tax=Aspergillus violaceofuscus (strain CBS 115571) TaxID=1450538 RepID=A0A2V5GQE2_ASPV1|nr:MFS transporter [Aspergillus violaceofuscus CBS 115571]
MSEIAEKSLNGEVLELDPSRLPWTESEERRVRRKIDFILLPILGLAFFALQLDRGNISTVLTSTITSDLNITTNQINVGSQLLSAGIVLTELPSNILLQRFGPKWWLSFQLLAWGLVATFQAFVSNYASFLATRLLLGLLEGGYIPGALFYLSTWYKKEELSSRVTLFFFGQMFSAATSNLISAGLLKLDQSHGLAGWRWVFLVEGLITVSIGIIFLLLLPTSTANARPLLNYRSRWSYFTPDEQEIIRQRYAADAHSNPTDDSRVRIRARDIWMTVRKPTIIQHFFFTLVSMSALSGLTTYTPTLIKSFGYDAIHANLLASVPVYCSMVLTFTLAYLSDRTTKRGLFVLLASTWNLIGYICLREMPSTASRQHKYGTIVAASVGYAAMHILNVAWLAVTCTTPQERSVALALVIMAANLSGISGGQIFRTGDAPLYRHGLTALCALAGAAWVQAVGLNVWYWAAGRKSSALKRGG